MIKQVEEAETLASAALASGTPVSFGRRLATSTPQLPHLRPRLRTPEDPRLARDDGEDDEDRGRQHGLAARAW